MGLRNKTAKEHKGREEEDLTAPFVYFAGFATFAVFTQNETSSRPSRLREQTTGCCNFGLNLAVIPDQYGDQNERGATSERALNALVGTCGRESTVKGP